MRLFLAILPDENVKKALLTTQDRLRKEGLKGRYIAEWNLHLTLAFIGEYADDERVLEIMEEVPFDPFSIRLEGYGAFGDTVWCGIAGNEQLSSYVKRLRSALSAQGIPIDKKPFVPHVTIVRRSEIGAGERLPGIYVPAAAMKVTEVSLMCSDQGKHGMNYTEIGSVVL